MTRGGAPVRRPGRWKPVAVAALAATAVAALGAISTELGSWYRGLTLPSWQPPDWLFGPVWTVIYALCAVAGVLAWRDAGDRATRERIVGAFALNGFLNVLWSLLFFRLHRPDWALWEVGLLWLSIVLVIVAVRRASTVAGWLLAPYLVWVAFAAALNAAVVGLNAPFG